MKGLIIATGLLALMILVMIGLQVRFDDHRVAASVNAAKDRGEISAKIDMYERDETARLSRIESKLDAVKHDR